jgi:PEP-CTERM motif-containing protein
MSRNETHPNHLSRLMRGAASLAAAMLICEASPAKADLMGATVSLGGYCCTSPTAPDLFTNVLTGTVPVSFPVGTLHSVTTLAVIPASFDITADQITETSAVAARASSGSFNGVVYDFSGLSSPITNVTVDPLSTIIPVSVAFTDHSVDVNVAGLSVAAGGKYILDVTTGGVVATPEPSSIALVSVGLAGLATIRRRRSRGKAQQSRLR